MSKQPVRSVRGPWLGALAIVAALTLSVTIIASLSYAAQRLPPTVRQELSVVNSHFPDTRDKRYPFLTFQVNFPSRYTATTGEMIESYDTAGGMAPPALLLVADKQPLIDLEGSKFGNADWYTNRYLAVRRSGRDCVVVWNLSNPVEELRVLSTRRERIGGHNVLERVIQDRGGGPQRVDASIDFSPIANVKYYFETCNRHSTEDLQMILRTFAVRAQ